MSLDFQQVRQQIIEMGKSAPMRVAHLQNLHKKALEALGANADQMALLRQKVNAALASNSNLRCAVPGDEPLTHHSTLPPLPEVATLLAADGSQINPDPHNLIDYCLVNVGAVQMHLGSPEPPTTIIETELIYHEKMYTDTGRLSEGLVALRRDLSERQLLAKLAQDAIPPIITLTDGPLELWTRRSGDQEAREYEEAFKSYLKTLHELRGLGASTLGYIDKPRGDLLVRLLEVAILPLDEIEHAGQRQHRRLLGVTDTELFRNLLSPGERSAIFGIQSPTTARYDEELKQHFFYLNVGTGEGSKSYPVRVEIPAWVAGNLKMVDDIHAILVQQCKILGTRTYPYLLHRSHEVAVVTLDDKKQVERMIALELYQRGLSVGETSHKQATKDLPGRGRG